MIRIISLPPALIPASGERPDPRPPSLHKGRGVFFLRLAGERVGEKSILLA